MQKTSHQASEQEAWSLEQWLNHLEIIHPSNIELGLERTVAVFKKLQLNLSQRKVITVAGTNGKGTTCAMIEQALLTANKTVAVFSSPHIIDYTERVRVAGTMLSEGAHCQAFLQVEQARGDIPLTYFEFGTLAALQLMADSPATFLILEVGLGGRLDAVNVVNPDIAVITGIDLDHQDWVGDTKELIAVEKAGIFRANIPAIIGDPNPPNSLLKSAKNYGVSAKWQGKDFSYRIDEKGFNWKGEAAHYNALPIPHIPAQNASTALQVIEVLDIALNHQQMNHVFKQTQLPGRRQVIKSKPTVMLDVAHNPQATTLLAADITNMQQTKVIAIVAMLADKDISASIAPMLPVVSTWYCASLDVPRGAKSSRLTTEVLSSGQKVLDYESVEIAYKKALEEAQQEDLIVVFGSFFTVAKILELGH
jgi:dihydrofolate synthase/folylpolyglutamate synthase